MGYLDFGRIRRVLMLDKAVYVEIRDDDKAVGQAGGIFLLASVVGGVWQILSLGDMPVYLLILFTIPLLIAVVMLMLLGLTLWQMAVFNLAT